jgi:hypothetical protein
MIVQNAVVLLEVRYPPCPWLQHRGGRFFTRRSARGELFGSDWQLDSVPGWRSPSSIRRERERLPLCEDGPVVFINRETGRQTNS